MAYGVVVECTGVAPAAFGGGLGSLAREGPASPPPPRLLDRVRAQLRTRHYSRRTEKTYVAWIRRYIFFHGKRHPETLGAGELTQFLSSLAVDGKVSASTQNQALSALLFLYRHVLELDVPWLDGLIRAKAAPRLPTVLSRAEVGAVIARMTGVPRLMAMLPTGPGSGCSSARGCGSRTWTSSGGRSSCGTGRATATA